ncbi:ribonuclease H-like domain-containing protein [Mucidula mucida]|nr:ribonuclease H-like domain-containing protein [Mucidula mucida]
MFLVSIRRCAFSYRASSRTLSSSTRKLQSTSPGYQKANEQPKAPVLSETNVPSHPSLLSAIKAPVFQPYDILLVVDFEGTCTETSGFDYPNEIIEFPIVLLKWEDKEKGKLVVHDEFRTMVHPTWKPNLTPFCTQLTGITQKEVDEAPPFPFALSLVQDFLVKNGVIDHAGEDTSLKFCWCTDGPWDLRELLLKQCFISKIPPPPCMIKRRFINTRYLVKNHLFSEAKRLNPHATPIPSMTLQQQLEALRIPLEGRLHSGIDDTRNISRIVQELARRGISLKSNERVVANRRWGWMGKAGQVREEAIIPDERRMKQHNALEAETSYNSINTIVGWKHKQ